MKSIVVYSGGMDSFTLLHETLISANRLGEEVHAISFNYGQRHLKELGFAAEVTAELEIPHQIVDMESIGTQLLSGSSQTSMEVEVPHGHYADENMKQTVVPNRNMIMLSLAIGYASSIGASRVLFGAHAGDHNIYPDCRPEFVSAMNMVSKVANYDPVSIIAPYLNYTKGDIAMIGANLNLDYGKTWTCYEGKEKPCGKCGACVERAEAMNYAGIADPLLKRSLIV